MPARHRGFRSPRLQAAGTFSPDRRTAHRLSRTGGEQGHGQRNRVTAKTPHSSFPPARPSTPPGPNKPFPNGPDTKEEPLIIPIPRRRFNVVREGYGPSYHRWSIIGGSSCRSKSWLRSGREKVKRALRRHGHPPPDKQEQATESSDFELITWLVIKSAKTDG